MEQKIKELKAILIQLLESAPLQFNDELFSQLPEEQGIYRISKKGSDKEASLRVGRTIKANGGLRQRLYQNHYMGTQQGNIRAQLIKSGYADNIDQAKVFLEEKCEVQILPIKDDELRMWAEYFSLAILQPEICE